MFLLFCSFSSYAQFTAADSLRGGYGNTRNWWDITHYDLSVEFDLAKKEIHGKNIISFKTIPAFAHGETHKGLKLQIDLQSPMLIDSVLLNEVRVQTTRILQKGNAYLIDYYGSDHSNNTETITVFFHGEPREAVHAPWDGGFIWSNDEHGSPWITVACQGLGASVWWPCKDSQVDEPDSVSMHYTVPKDLVCVSNGTFVNRQEEPHNKTTYTWNVSNPINNYCMIPYIGDYVNIHNHFQGENGNLEVDYWVLRGHEEKARKQFQDVPKTLQAFEYWFGSYPFYADGYKLVEAPHLGMEHQSAVAYGNGFKNGYMGKDLSGTGEGLKWDFIIIHESGHEWFGNSITSKDIADMWIHESFTNYSETLFMDYWFGTTAANTYCKGLQKNILNDRPIIGQYGVQNEGSGDMYYKGANMLHTIRTLVADDSLFRSMLREMNQTFYHKTVTTPEIETFMSAELGMDLSKVFDQYLRTKNPPTFECIHKHGKMKYRWNNCIRGFNMPVVLSGKRYDCSPKWHTIKTSVPLVVDSNMYIL